MVVVSLSWINAVSWRSATNVSRSIGLEGSRFTIRTAKARRRGACYAPRRWLSRIEAMPSESVSRASGGMKLRPYACEAVMWYSAITIAAGSYSLCSAWSQSLIYSVTRWSKNLAPRYIDPKPQGPKRNEPRSPFTSRPLSQNHVNWQANWRPILAFRSGADHPRLLRSIFVGRQ
ncbi:hypothetical protein C8Q69DRAFT_218871 [Paecilomyces variotii]|uniref:Uncharacterized protein n=1 Tax=Byssochlamys spectabilis TaxID=264951 RepID=A0A443HZ94_BYSSP|nr:hypothetical protein C8Q69DRAFT_218871 [Paecilomyces variotii]RWQ97169.1 hypothetical protein C8Q69DRAFT_218871 [Paecilomyces variotii]